MIMRKSKYDDLVGKIFSGAKLVETRMVDKKSKKTGKEYRVRRFWMTADGEHTLEIGTQSFKNESYLKRLDKITTEWIYSYEWVKEEDDVEFKVDSFEDTFEEWCRNWKFQKEIDDLCRATFDGKESAQHRFEYLCQMMKENDNMNVAGQTIYHSKEEYFKHWNDFEIKGMEKDIQEEVDLGDYKRGFVWSWGFKVAELNEWRTEFSQKLWEFIQDEWENMEERRRNAQKSWRDRMFGAGWEQRWERENFGSQIDMRVNEYDKVFKDLTPKEAKRKMRELSKLLHPDVHPELDGTEFKDMHSAYERYMSRVA